MSWSEYSIPWETVMTSYVKRVLKNLSSRPASNLWPKKTHKRDEGTLLLSGREAKEILLGRCTNYYHLNLINWKVAHIIQG